MGDCHFMYLGLRVESDVALVVDGVPLHALLGLDLVEAGDRAVTAKFFLKKTKNTPIPTTKKVPITVSSFYPYIPTSTWTSSLLKSDMCSIPSGTVCLVGQSQSG